jgi:PAS domain S-box-containing protein
VSTREGALRARYEALWEHAPLGVVVYDTRLSVVDCNDTFARMIGSPRERLIGLGMDELRDQRHREPLRRALAGEVVASYGASTVTTSSRWLWLRATFVPLRDGSEAVDHAMVLLSDGNPEGTSRVFGQLTRQLTEMQRIARAATWTWDAARGVYALSPELHDLLGTDRSTFVPTLEALAQLIPADERASVAEELDDVFRERRHFAQREIGFVRTDGEPRAAIVRGDWHYDGAGRPVSAWGTVQDVTRERALEERYRQSQKMEPIGRLTASMAHDFNNLLTVILTNLGMAADSLPADADVHTELGDALSAATRATTLVRRLLDYGRRQQQEFSRVNVNDILSSVHDLLKGVLGKGITLETSLHPSLWPVFGDAHQLEQLLMNLAVNACDAMPDGGRFVVSTSNVSLHERSPDEAGMRPGDYVLLSVLDSGEGIDPSVLPQIFEPFFTTKAPGRGTGLGLSIVYGIVTQMGGCVYAGTAPGGGALFQVFLPRCAQAGQPPRCRERFVER